MLISLGSVSIWIWTALPVEWKVGCGVGLGVALGLPDEPDGPDAAGWLGVCDGVAVRLGRAIGGRLLAVSPATSSWPAIMSATPARASSSGTSSPGESRRFIQSASLASVELMTDPGPMPQPSSDSFDLALSRAADALGASPAGLLTDLDGTLAPIVRDPAAVRLAPGAADALRSLARRLAVVAVISGRAALDVRRLVEVPSLLVAGNHGVEWLEPESSEPQFAPALADVPAALQRLLSVVPAIDGVTVDDKRLSATVHYRRTTDPAAARRSILQALTAALDAGVAGETGIELREGRMSIELRPREAGDKGSAVVTVVDRFALRGLVVLGDDLTDLDMFRQAGRLRTEGRLRAAIIGVGGHGEVPEQVAAAADAVLPDPASVARLLAAV